MTDDELLNQQPWSVGKPEHGSAAWLKARKWRFGETLVAASDAAAVHGVHRFKSMTQLALELLDPNDPQPVEPNAAMRRGNELEPLLLQWASTQLGCTVASPTFMYGYGRCVATLDGITTDKKTIVECKTTVRRFNGVLPAYWKWQGVQQAICYGATRVMWAVLDGDLQLSMTEQVVTDDDMLTHLRAVDNFLAAIDMGMLPPEAVPTLEEIARMNPEPSPVPAELPDNAHELMSWYHTANAQVKQAQQELDAAKAEIASLLGASEVGTLDGREVVTWKVQSRSSFDAARFEAEHPTMAAQYQKKSSFRVLRVKGGK